MVANNFLEWLNLNYETKNTIRDYNNYTNHFFASYQDFNQENINAYLTKRLEEGVKKSTFNKIVNVLKAYAKFMKMEINFPKSKTTDVRIKDYITLQELEEKVLPMIDLIFNNDAETYDLLIRVMFFTGVRVEEAITLEKSNIDFSSGKIRIINTKGKVDREVPFLDQKLQNDLEKYCNSLKVEKVFDLSYYQVWYNLKKLEQEIQWGKRIHPHFFRVSFAKHCVMLGIHMSVIQKLLGHKDANTTQIYCNPDEKMVLEACAQHKRKEV